MRLIVEEFFKIKKKTSPSVNIKQLKKQFYEHATLAKNTPLFPIPFIIWHWSGSARDKQQLLHFGKW